MVNLHAPRFEPTTTLILTNLRRSTERQPLSMVIHPGAIHARCCLPRLNALLTTPVIYGEIRNKWRRKWRWKWRWKKIQDEGEHFKRKRETSTHLFQFTGSLLSLSWINILPKFDNVNWRSANLMGKSQSSPSIALNASVPVRSLQLNNANPDTISGWVTIEDSHHMRMALGPKPSWMRFVGSWFRLL